MTNKERLDVLLTEQGYAATRSKAQAIIMAGQVYVNGQKADKPGVSYEDTVQIEVRGETCPYVSRGGYKLEKAMEIALAGIAQEYGLTQAQLQQMEYNREYAGYTFAVVDGRAICELWFWLHQDEDVIHSDGDGLYWARINAETGAVETMMYDSALAGNG